ncbi:MAG: class I SAM-dependent RNA methyltransferase [Desulfobacterota bacterium]|jgi:putative N6-adenine-specific DNA methylase|nr:class I SAM-dependent RNA methyltransferase [Thermodesulfobacteriota bacterium]
MFQYQLNHRFFAQVPEGIEELAARELVELGAERAHPSYRGVYFDAGKAVLYRVNYGARLATRILAPLTSFRCHSTDYLYRKSKEISWEEFFTADQTFAVFANVTHSKIHHSQYAALRLKDAVADAFKERCGTRPSVSRGDPEVWIGLYVEHDRATISLDTSGGSLHRRGYREEGGEAPMQEIIAAAVIRLSEWDGSRPLYDLMCGSGTLLSEALMAFCRIPAGYRRPRFGFQFLPDYEAPLWLSVKKEMDGAMQEPRRGLISGSDIAEEAVATAMKNLTDLPYGDRVRLTVGDFRSIPDLGGRVILCNPPYGIRLDRGRDLGPLYRDLGDFLKQRCSGSSAFVYFGNREWIGHVGLKPSWKKPLKSGGLDGRLVKYEMY